MSMIAKIDHSAIRRKLSHDLRASLFNIDGFLHELRASLVTLQELVDEHRDDLPRNFAAQFEPVLKDDTTSCVDFLESATAQLHERIEMLTVTAESTGE